MGHGLRRRRAPVPGPAPRQRALERPGRPRLGARVLPPADHLGRRRRRTGAVARAVSTLEASLLRALRGRVDWARRGNAVWRSAGLQVRRVHGPVGRRPRSWPPPGRSAASRGDGSRSPRPTRRSPAFASSGGTPLLTGVVVAVGVLLAADPGSPPAGCELVRLARRDRRRRGRARGRHRRSRSTPRPQAGDAAGRRRAGQRARDRPRRVRAAAGRARQPRRGHATRCSTRWSPASWTSSCGRRTAPTSTRRSTRRRPS